MKTIIFIFATVVFGCNIDYLAELDRLETSPGVVDVSVSLFKEPYTVTVSWKCTDLADSYRLYRSSDPISGFTKVYDGNDCSFVDQSIAIKDRDTYYKVAMVRGIKELPQSVTAQWAIATNQMMDSHEPNGSMELATKISQRIDANIAYFMVGSTEVFRDTDWYKFALDPYSHANFKITLEDQTIPGGELEFYTVSDAVSYSINSGSSYEINNPTANRTDIYFQIAPANPGSLDPQWANQFKGYQIVLEQIKPGIQ